MKNITWKNIWGTFILLFVIVVVFIIFKGLTFNHVVRSYYLNSYERKPRIMVDIDWVEDDCLSLPDTVSFPEAIKMIEDLNKSLVK